MKKKLLWMIAVNLASLWNWFLVKNSSLKFGK